MPHILCSLVCRQNHNLARDCGVVWSWLAQVITIANNCNKLLKDIQVDVLTSECRHTITQWHLLYDDFSSGFWTDALTHTQHSLAALVLDRASSEEFKGNRSRRGGDRRTEENREERAFSKHLLSRCARLHRYTAVCTTISYPHGDSDGSSSFCCQFEDLQAKMGEPVSGNNQTL